MELVTLLLPLQGQRDPVSPEQRPVGWIVMVALRRYLDRDVVACTVKAADEREGRIAPKQPALTQLVLERIDHAAARTMHGMELNLVKPLHRCCSGEGGTIALPGYTWPGE